jgi:dGTPase
VAPPGGRSASEWGALFTRELVVGLGLGLDVITELRQALLTQALLDLRSFMFDHVYRNPVAKGEESKAKAMLTKLFEYYVNCPEKLPADFQPQMSFDGLERTVCDYIAGMTDNYAVDKYSEIFVPTGWHVRG